MGYSQTQKNIRRQKRRLYNINEVDWNNPVAAGQCDGCKAIVRHDELQWQIEYRGGIAPISTGLLVCRSCKDVPQPYFQLQVLAPDPVPVKNPRPDSDVSFALVTTIDRDYLVTTVDRDQLDWT